MSISRRVFVRSGGLALFSLGLGPLFRARAAFASYRPLPSSTALSRPILVCLFQRGAVDGLSMIVPHGDPLYYRERPRIAVPREDVVDLDGYFGLHPRLAPLKPLWDDGILAAVHAIGLPDATSNHFEAQAYLESGTPGPSATPEGWLTRSCREDGGRTVEYPHGRPGDVLRDIARLIKTDAGLRAARADVTGWDTHMNQGASEGRLATRLGELGQALAAFTRDLGERMRDVVVLTMSEFGRTIRENGSAGTDHGHATAMLVLGGPVKGGKVLGTWPGLEGRDVGVTTDFRDLVAEILRGHLGVRDLSPIFPGFAPDSARFPGAIRG